MSFDHERVPYSVGLPSVSSISAIAIVKDWKWIWGSMIFLGSLDCAP